MKTNTELASRAYLTDLHQNYTEWIDGLHFYKDDLNVFLRRLEEVLKKNNSIDVTALVEHFQNQFIIQRNEIDTLLHEIKLKERELVEYAKANPVAIDHVRFKESLTLVDRMNRFEDLWKGLRQEFLTFTSKWM